MKTLLVAVLFSLVIIGRSQPIEKESAISMDVTTGLEKPLELNDDSAFADMEGSESSLKVIENKLEYWLKKYYKKTDKMNNNGFEGFPQTGFPMMGYPLYPALSYPLTGYGYGGLGGMNGFNLGLGGLGSGLGGGLFGPGLGGFSSGLGSGGYGYGNGFGTGLGSGGYGYGNGFGGLGSFGGFGYRR